MAAVGQWRLPSAAILILSPMRKPKTQSNGATPLPAADGIREMDKACDSFEARLAKIESEVKAQPLLSLAEHLKQAADDLSQHAHECRFDENTEWYYRARAEQVSRAASIIMALAIVPLDITWKGAVK